MKQLAVQPLFYILFLYGLSFVLVGVLIVRAASRAERVPFVLSFYALALFGFAHGASELLGWTALVVRTLSGGDTRIFTDASGVVMVISYIILLQFAAHALTFDRRGARLVRSLPVAAAVAGLVIVTVLGIRDLGRVCLLGRHVYGFSGGLLAAAALFRMAQTVRPLGDTRLVRGFSVAGGAFACYAVFGGVIVTPIAGVPVQVFRSACAVVIALSIGSALGAYGYVSSRATVRTAEGV